MLSSRVLLAIALVLGKRNVLYLPHRCVAIDLFNCGTAFTSAGNLKGAHFLADKTVVSQDWGVGVGTKARQYLPQKEVEGEQPCPPLPNKGRQVIRTFFSSSWYDSNACPLDEYRVKMQLRLVCTESYKEEQ